jgi:polyisoprenoid-binding protein YceI
MSSLLALVLLAAPAALAATTFDVDAPHTSVLFSIRHLVTEVQGKFTKFNGAIVYDAKNPGNSSVEFTVDAASIDTANGKRDDHLRSADFFDVAQFPALAFKSEKVKAKGKDQLEVTGVFTMRGVSKTITVPAKILGVIESKDWGTKAGFSASFVINRKDFGMSWNKALDVGGLVLGDDVTVTLNVEANGKAAAN